MTVIDVAFGRAIGDDTDAFAVSPPVVTGTDRWMQAVAAGARGHYARALTELRQLRAAEMRGAASTALMSLASSTVASHLRQCGRHDTARRFDGDAVALAVAAPDGPIATAAMIDGLVGLAADHLGLGALDVADRLLRRASEVSTAGPHAPEPEDWVWSGRPELRLAWVRTELCLYGGDPTGAGSAAGRAREVVGDCPSPRHVLKTDLIEAATRAACGRIDPAAELALDCLRRADALRLDPLRWASAALVLGLGTHVDEPTRVFAADQEAASRRSVNARGGTLRPAH